MNIFQGIQPNRVKRNKFDLSHERKMSMNMGKLVPMMCQEVVPGDKFRVNAEVMMRLAPMLAPIMHRVDVYTHFFFVPNRLLWNEWEDFITGGRDGQSSPIHPHIIVGNGNKSLFRNGTLPDYLGFPSWAADPAAMTNHQISALPFRAYQTIFNEYYRDQNLAAPIAFGTGSGVVNDANEVTRLVTLRDRAWEKDYFTSALPWSQRGGEALIPMESGVTYSDTSQIYTDTGGTPANGTLDNASGELQVGSEYARIENIQSIDNINTSINDLRKSLRLQEWLERAARGGARYIEQMFSHFGVKSSDARLQRPEYLGGGKNPVVISEVMNTVGTTDFTEGGFAPQGQLAGYGLSMGSSNSFNRFFEEHGFIIGIISVLPKTAYQQGLPKYFTRPTKFDYFWPEFANLGEQEVANKEVYLVANDNTGDNEQTFGYQSRYAEYKYSPSTVHGDFKSNMNYWHLGRVFTSKPNLNESFVMANPDHRIFAVTDPTVHKLYVQIYNRVDALRPMPFFGTPIL